MLIPLKLTCQAVGQTPVMACSDVQKLQGIGRKAFDAASVIYPAVLISGLVQSAWLAGDSGCQAYIKLENEQVMRDVCCCVTLLHPSHSWWAHCKFLSLLPILQVTKSFKVRGATYRVRICACFLHTYQLETYGLMRAQCNSCAGCLLACGQAARRDMLIREPCTCCASCMPGIPEKVMASMASGHSMCLSAACFVRAREALWPDSLFPRQISGGLARFL